MHATGPTSSGTRARSPDMVVPSHPPASTAIASHAVRDELLRRGPLIAVARIQVERPSLRQRDRRGEVGRDRVLELVRRPGDVRLVAGAGAEGDAEAAGRDELADVAEDVVHAVVAVVAGACRRASRSGTPNGTCHQSTGLPSPSPIAFAHVQVLVEVGRRLVRLVPVPGAVVALAGRIDVRPRSSPRRDPACPARSRRLRRHRRRSGTTPSCWRCPPSARRGSRSPPWARACAPSFRMQRPRPDRSLVRPAHSGTRLVTRTETVAGVPPTSCCA